MIHGLTPRLAEAGKIKIGWKVLTRKKNSEETFLRPVKLDHFIITKTTRNPETGLLEVDARIMDALSGADKAANTQEAKAIRERTKIRELPIVLHSDDIEEVAPSRMAMYGGPSKCLCSGDGLWGLRTAYGTDVVIPGTDVVPTVPTHCAFNDKNPCGYYKSKNPRLQCKPNTKLACSLLVPGASIAGSVYVHRTSSEIAHEQLQGSLAQVQRVIGSVRGVPLWLVVRPIMVRPEGKPETVFVCHVELKAPSIFDVQTKVLESRKMEAAIGAPVQRLALAPIGEEDDEEAREVSEEFYPSAVLLPEAAEPEAPKERARETAGPKTQAKNGGGLAGRIRGGGKRQRNDEVPPHDPETGEVLERQPGDDDPDGVG